MQHLRRDLTIIDLRARNASLWLSQERQTEQAEISSAIDFAAVIYSKGS